MYILKELKYTADDLKGKISESIVTNKLSGGMVEKIFANKIYMFIFAIIVTALWGSLFPCIKLGYAAFDISSDDVFSIILFAGIRFVISGIIFVLFLFINNKKTRVPDKSNILVIMQICIVSIVLHYIFTYIGLSLSEGSKGAILKQVGSVFVICFSGLVFKDDKFTINKLVGGLVGFVSIIIINFDGVNLVFNFLGDGFLILASFCSAMVGFMSKKAYLKHSPIYITSFAQLFGGIILLFTGLIMGGRITRVSFDGIIILLYMVIASTIAYAIWNTLIKYTDLSKLYVIKFLEPMFGVIFSGLLLNENIIKLSYISAFILVCTGIYIGNKRFIKGEF